MHRELYNFYVHDDVVVVELSPKGTHNGALKLPAGTLTPTAKNINAPCCDVFLLKDGKVVSFHCCRCADSPGATRGLMNLQAALKH